MQDGDSSLPPIVKAASSGNRRLSSVRRQTYDVAKVAPSSKTAAARGNRSRRARRRHTYDADERSRPHPLTLTGSWEVRG